MSGTKKYFWRFGILFLIACLINGTPIQKNISHPLVFTFTSKAKHKDNFCEKILHKEKITDFEELFQVCNKNINQNNIHEYVATLYLYAYALKHSNQKEALVFLKHLSAVISFCSSCNEIKYRAQVLQEFLSTATQNPSRTWAFGSGMNSN